MAWLKLGPRFPRTVFREVLAVEALIKDEKKKIADRGMPADLRRCSDEWLLTKALEAKRTAGWCDVSTLQLGENGNQHWVVVFHYHGHKY